MNRRRMILMTAFATTIGAGIAGQRPASAADQLKLAIGQPGLWDSSFAEIAQKEGIFARHGLEVQVFYTSGGGETQLTDRDLNFVAAVTGDRVLREASPSFRAFDFPFYVGKEWRSVFTYQDNARSLSWSPEASAFALDGETLGALVSRLTQQQLSL